MTPPMSPARQVLRLLVLLALVGGGAAAFLLPQERAFVAASQRKSGQIVAKERRGRAYRYVVELAPSDGASGVTRVRIPAPPLFGLKVGDRVPLRVHTATGEAKQASTWGLHQNTLLVLFVCGFLFLVALGGVVRGRQR